MLNQILLLLKVRVAPNSEPTAKIKTWATEYQDPVHGGFNFWADLQIAEIPLGLTCNLLGPYHEAGVPIAGGVTNSIVALTYRNAIKFGESEDGFLLLEFFEDRIEQMFHRAFRIRVTDVLGGESGMQIRPGAWLKLAEFNVPSHIIQANLPRGLLGVRRVIPPPE